MIEAVRVTKALHLGKSTIHALRGVDLTIDRGEMVAIVGPSGSGKSTLLGILGGLDKPTSGTIRIDGVDVTHLNEDQLTELRNEKIGFIFQFFNLIPTLTALENVALPMQFAKRRVSNPNKRAKELLNIFGLSDRLNHRPFELSGGQQQRVAIARALANNPPILLADEPTGNLDQESGATVIQALKDIHHNAQTTIIIVTHDTNLSNLANRVFHLVDGQILENITPIT
ncbi:MAG: macrolide ABC transporter ATP-binding protein [Phototrophicales bacterium]|nr:MAG: macrolide ABC transporter ATP-binding protein [Phototrophicales bacterium]